MTTHTSLVASQIRLQHWADQIRSCQSRPEGMDVETWCNANGVSKANYYYRLKRVRAACIDHLQSGTPQFVELPVPKQPNASGTAHGERPSAPAILHGPKGISLELSHNAPPEFVRTLIRAFVDAQ